MNKQSLLGKWAYFHAVHGVTLRLISSFEEKDLDYRPAPGSRSVKELVAHLYGMEKTMSEGIWAGKLTQASENRAIPETEEGKAEIAPLTSKAKLIEYAQTCHQAADTMLAGISDERLAADIETPFGTFKTWQLFGFMYDEHWHHRGQLYVYARLLGRSVPMLYDYEGNATAAA